MSKFRPECSDAGPEDPPALSDATALWLIRNAVAKRRSLIHGRLRSNGGRCAMGCFFDDNRGAVVHSSLIDEVAAVNDSMPNATPHQRWRKVNEWLRFKIASIAKSGK